MTQPHHHQRPLPQTNRIVLACLGRLLDAGKAGRPAVVGAVPAGVVRFDAMLEAVHREGYELDRPDLLGVLSGLEAVECITINPAGSRRPPAGYFAVALHPHRSNEPPPPPARPPRWLWASSASLRSPHDPVLFFDAAAAEMADLRNVYRRLRRSGSVSPELARFAVRYSLRVSMQLDNMRVGSRHRPRPSSDDTSGESGSGR